MQATDRAARLWLATGAGLLVSALVFHGPPDPDLTVQSSHIADGGNRWAIVHWTAAVALFLMSGGAFLTLFSTAAGSIRTGQPGAWMIMALGALTTFTTAVSEAAVLAAAAHAGDQAAFDTWWAFSTGMANGFFALVIAVGLIALGAFRAKAEPMPKWVAAIGMAAGFLSAIGGPIWLIATMVMCLWLIWFALAGFADERHAREASA